MNFQDKVASRIVEARKKANLTQGELADACGISRGRLSNWEVGNRLPKPQEAKKLAEALSVPAAWLYCLSDTLHEYETNSGRIKIIPIVELDKITNERIIADIHTARNNPSIESLNLYDFVPLKISRDAEEDHNIFGIVLTDESMQPELYKNDLLIISPSTSPTPGKLVAAMVNNHPSAVIRRYTMPAAQQIKLTAQNTDWPSYDGDVNSIKILGTVIELQRSL